GRGRTFRLGFLAHYSVNGDRMSEATPSPLLKGRGVRSTAPLRLQRAASVDSSGVNSFFCLLRLAAAFRPAGVVTIVIPHPFHRVFEIVLVATFGRQIQNAIRSHH